MPRWLPLVAAALTGAGCGTPDQAVIRVGSLRDVEGQVLGEIVAQTIERVGEASVERRLGLGGTGVVFTALDAGEVDVVPQYSGTLADVVLRQPTLADFEAIRSGASAKGYVVSPRLGFNNTYGIGVRRAVAERFQLRSVSDLRGRPWRGGVTPEFLDAPTGMASAIKTYDLSLGPVRAMEHAVSYVALAAGDVDFVDVYTTDAAIRQQDLVVLQDDRGAFVRYDGVVLARADFATRFPKSWAALERLAGRLSDSLMTALNTRFQVDRVSPNDVAAAFLTPDPNRAPTSRRQAPPPLLRLTAEHTSLVVISLAAALLLGVPLGIWSAHRPAVSRWVLSLTGAVQTVPGVALLCFFIPIFGIGWEPAVYALALYALLPVVQGVITGAQAVDRGQREMALVLGMSDWTRRRTIEWPLAAPAVLAGIRVAAVTNVGTAALAALIGAGGYGTLIVTGLALNDWRVVMQGALPSAAMAMMLHVILSAAESRLTRWR